MKPPAWLWDGVHRRELGKARNWTRYAACLVLEGHEEGWHLFG
jgi:hypothetical protein